jgi:hypothetical protein
MKKPSNQAKAIYLTWVLIHFGLWVSNGAKSNDYVRGYFYPFTNRVSNHFFKTYYYDITEFLFYTIVPILIYYIITLFKSKDQTPQ